MGCGSCGSGANGKPGGCKGNGGCSTGGCNRLNVHDWLNGIPLNDGARPYPIIEVSFNKGSRKEFFRNSTYHLLEKNDWITVEGVGGYDVGQVSLKGELVKLQMKKYGVKEVEVTKRVLHPATEEELEQCGKQKDRGKEVMVRARAIATSLNLNMKVCEVEIQADSKKGTFFYTADQRVDFRELIKLFAGDFKMKVEMRQIGTRQESGKVGGIGSCGRELCCATWLTDFKSVNTTAARYQNLSINQTKLSGQCGRLKCCLNYELDTYMDALSIFPDHADNLETVKGVAHLQKRDIFKSLMWYSYSDNNKQYPLSIKRVKEIQQLNKQGQKADELQPVEIETKESRTGVKADVGFINDVGQIALKTLEKHPKKKKKSGGGGRDQQSAQGGQPQRGKESAGKQTSPESGQPAGKSQAQKPQGQQQRPAAGQSQQQPQRNKGQQAQGAGGNQPQAAPGGKQQPNKPQQNKNQPQKPNPQSQNKPQQQAGEGGPGQQPKQPKPQKPNRPQHNRHEKNRPGEASNDNTPKPEQSA